MRRNDRTVKDIYKFKEIVSKCQVVRVTICKDDEPYLVPLKYGYEFNDEELILYCYCSNKSKNLDILDKNPNIFIEIDDEENLVKDNTPYEFEFKYSSIKSPGKVEFIYNIYDKIHGLNKIIEHCSSKGNNELKHKTLNEIVLLKITCNNLSAI